MGSWFSYLFESNEKDNDKEASELQLGLETESENAEIEEPPSPQGLKCGYLDTVSDNTYKGLYDYLGKPYKVNDGKSFCIRDDGNIPVLYPRIGMENDSHSLFALVSKNSKGSIFPDGVSETKAVLLNRTYEPNNVDVITDVEEVSNSALSVIYSQMGHDVTDITVESNEDNVYVSAINKFGQTLIFQFTSDGGDLRGVISLQKKSQCSVSADAVYDSEADAYVYSVVTRR